MLIQGVIRFGAAFGLQKTNKGQSIAWNSGLIEYPDFSQQHSFLDTTIVGFEGNDQNDVKIWSPDTPVLASFFDFNAYLSTSGNRLGVGVWYREAQRTLHLARNLFGTVPLYYLHLAGQFCIFSTDLHALLGMVTPHVSVSLDEHRLSSFLTFSRDQFIDYSGDTFYREIKCVLPGHLLTITPSGCTTEPYTKFNLPKGTDSSSGYAERFRSLFQDAVRQHICFDDSPIGAHLSGGLDSSSICSIASRLAPQRALHTFYYDTQGQGSDDQEYAREVARNIRSYHREIAPSNDPLGTIISHTRILGYPQPAFVPPTFYDGVFQMAKELQCRTLLNGNGGDSIVGSGFEFLATLYKQRNWPLLKDLLSRRTPYFTKADQYKNWERLTREQQTRIVEQNFLYQRLSASLRSASAGQMWALYRDLSAHFELSPSYFAKRALEGLGRKLKGHSHPPVSLLRQNRFQEAGVIPDHPRKLSTSLRGKLATDHQQTFEEIYNQHTISNNESRFIFGQHYGFQSRSPFLHQPLFELCLSIPETIKYGNGLGRMHFREAMKDILPEHVRLRSQKAHVGKRGKTATLQLYEQSKELLYDTAGIWEYVDKKKFDDTVKFLQTDHLPVEHYNRSLFHVTRIVSVAVWLEWLKSKKWTGQFGH